MQAGGGVVVVVARRECNAKWCECVVWETESMCEDVNIIENVVKETNATENIELIGKTNKSWDWQICYIMLNQRNKTKLSDVDVAWVCVCVDIVCAHEYTNHEQVCVEE